MFTRCAEAVSNVLRKALRQVDSTPGHPWNDRAFGPACVEEFWKAPRYTV